MNKNISKKMSIVREDMIREMKNNGLVQNLFYNNSFSQGENRL